LIGFGIVPLEQAASALAICLKHIDHAGTIALSRYIGINTDYWVDVFVSAV